MIRLLIAAALVVLSACSGSPSSSPVPPSPPPSAAAVWSGPTGETLIIQSNGTFWSQTDGGSTARTGSLTTNGTNVLGTGVETSFGVNAQVNVSGSFSEHISMSSVVNYIGALPAMVPAVEVAQSSVVPTTELTNRMIVKYKTGGTTAQADAGRKHALTVSHAADRGVTIQVHRASANNSVIMKLDRELSVPQVLELGEALKASDSDVEWVEADRRAYPMYTPNDTFLPNMWGLIDQFYGINAPKAWDRVTGRGVVVAVIDTGYRPHADLVGNLVPGIDFVSDVVGANDGDGRDNNAIDPGDNCSSTGSTNSWHGTHVAGTIAALGNNSTGVVGVAFTAQVQPLRVLGRCGGFVSDIADAIIWGAGGSVPGINANPTPAKVLNLSLGGEFPCSASPTYINAVQVARNLGAVVIVSAGNSAKDAAGFSPASCPGVVSVAAADQAGNRAGFSNFGSSVALAAPGVSILSTLNTGTTFVGVDSYQYYSGTSMAAPHVSGVAALMFSRNPFITGVEVEQRLRSSTRSFVGFCPGCGSGMLDAHRAVLAAGVGSRWTFNAASDAIFTVLNGNYSGFTGAGGSVLASVSGNGFSGTSTLTGIVCSFNGTFVPAPGYAETTVTFGGTCGTEFSNQQLPAVLFNNQAGKQVLLVKGSAGSIATITLTKL